MMLHKVVFLLLVVSAAGHGPFSGHKVIRVIPHTEYDLETLKALLQNTRHLDIWRYPSTVNSPVDIRVSPFDYNDVIEGLHESGLPATVLIKDVQELMDSQKAARDTLKYKSKLQEFDYSKYHTLDEINAWMANKTDVYSDMVSMFNVTMSYEGRPMTGIKISTPSTGVIKPAFWIEGGIHAREWISPATVIYMAGKMLDYFNTDPELADLVKDFDWYILPVTNPDGYVYTWKNEESRMWRKTRSRHGLCVGVDPNRNWDMEWCKEGASKDPCSDTYCGPSAFSEVEVKGVADFVTGLKNLRGFIDFHSYSQMWMSPWGYTKKLPKDFEEQDDGSQKAVDALEKVYGTKFVHGSIARTVYVSSGSSADWVYGKNGIKFSYGVELRDTGKYGFLLPADQIVPSGEETLQALKALAQYIISKEISQ